jgi:hypothetical protein
MRNRIENINGQSALANGLRLVIDPAVLEPLIASVVEATLARIDAARAGSRLDGDRLAYSEKEAARLLDLNVWQLRDERLAGRITASTIVGRRVRYLREDLLNYLMRHRTAEARPAPPK